MVLIWNRKTKDPLISLFLDKYGLHLLALPRENVAVGDWYVYDGKQVSAAGRIGDLYDAPFQLPATIVGEKLSDIAGVVSDGVSAKLGLGLLETFLRALGGFGLASKVRLGYETEKTKSVKFRFAHATRDYLKSIVLLGAYLWGKEIIRDFPFGGKGLHYYLVSGVVRTPSISVIGEDEKKNVVKSEVVASNLADFSGDVAVEMSAKGEITFSGKREMAFGVELHELQYNAETRRMTIKMPPNNYVPVRGGRSPRKERPVFIGGEEDDVFLDVVEK